MSKEREVLLIFGYLRTHIHNFTINNMVNIVKYYCIIPYEWDKNTLLNGLILSNKNLIVKHNGSNHRNHTIICDIIFENGINYFEIKILNIKSIFDIFIGFVKLNYKPNTSYVGFDNGWGYCSDSKLYSDMVSDWYSKNYGKEYGSNDIIKCEINYNKNIIVYYINGIDQGIAFNNITYPVKPAVSLYSVGNSIELLHVWTII